jgi:hypothetical protein
MSSITHRSTTCHDTTAADGAEEVFLGVDTHKDVHAASADRPPAVRDAGPMIGSAEDRSLAPGSPRADFSTCSCSASRPPPEPLSPA